MSVLTDTDLMNLICSNENQLDGEKVFIANFEESNLTPLGYDLRVGGYYKTYGSGKVSCELTEDKKLL
jgi:deoxycytidine triphosphate deaminase